MQDRRCGRAGCVTRAGPQRVSCPRLTGRHGCTGSPRSRPGRRPAPATADRDGHAPLAANPREHGACYGVCTSREDGSWRDYLLLLSRLCRPRWPPLAPFPRCSGPQAKAPGPQARGEEAVCHRGTRDRGLGTRHDAAAGAQVGLSEIMSHGRVPAAAGCRAGPGVRPRLKVCACHGATRRARDPEHRRVQRGALWIRVGRRAVAPWIRVLGPGFTSAVQRIAGSPRSTGLDPPSDSM